MKIVTFGEIMLRIIGKTKCDRCKKRNARIKV